MSTNTDRTVTVVQDPKALIDSLRRDGKPVPEILQLWEKSKDGPKGP